ncbi:MAG: hypothetical protein OES27_05285 [Nitrosopumilus sp.]|nr:hypothetical protein [Nitrosopumilus sp.]
MKSCFLFYLSSIPPCPSAIILLISNLLDVLTYFFQKETDFSRFKVIGIASSLDTSRFRYLISKNFSVPQSFITGVLVLGEHVDSMIPVFSRMYVDVAPLLSLLDEDEKSFIIDDVRTCWKDLRNYKSRSQFGTAKNAFDIINAILNAKDLFVPASVVLQDEYGENDVAMGAPVIINQYGISKIEDLKLDEFEFSLLKKSSQKLHDQIDSI